MSAPSVKRVSAKRRFARSSAAFLALPRRHAGLARSGGRLSQRGAVVALQPHADLLEELQRQLAAGAHDDVVVGELPQLVVHRHPHVVRVDLRHLRLHEQPRRASSPPAPGCGCGWRRGTCRTPRRGRRCATSASDSLGELDGGLERRVAAAHHQHLAALVLLRVDQPVARPSAAPRPARRACAACLAGRWPAPPCAPARGLGRCPP